MRTWATAFLLAVALLAGCADKAADTGDKLRLADGTTIQLGEGTSDTQGAIAGYVVDEAIRPLIGVELATPDGAHTASTDDKGFFLLGFLDPGFYALTARAPGFTVIQASGTDVVAGETATVKVQMTRDLAPQPYHETFPYDGFMQAWGTIGQWAVEIVAPTPFCQCVYQVAPGPNTTALVFEAFWEPTVPDPAAMSQFYWEVFDEDATWIQSGYCTNPCRADVGLVDAEGDAMPQGQPISVRISGPDAWVAYQQQVHLYTTAFYNGEDATGFSIAAPA